jgi:hypothetical protein
MTRPSVRTFRTVEHALAGVDQIVEDQPREWKTATLTDMPAQGVDVDHDVMAALVEQQRREWVTQRAQLRRELLE